MMKGGNAGDQPFHSVTKDSGTKFGKNSKGGAIWLDPEKTATPYELDQFWINTADADVVKYLKFFTFLSHEESEELAQAVENEPHLRKVSLAEEIHRPIHGLDPLDQAIKISAALFSGDVKKLSAAFFEVGFKDVPKL